MIAVDIGNTSLNFVWFKKGRVTKSIQISTSLISKNQIRKLLSRYPKQLIIVCSVVPAITKLFCHLQQKVYIIGKDIKVPLPCLYNKKEIGMDRLVSAYAARELFSRVRLVLDFGTAITLDMLSPKGDYQGGIILPGVGSSLRVFSQCALLPKKIKIIPTSRLIPRNTQESISKGLKEGFSLMINALVKKYIKILKISSRDIIVVTGGEAPLVMSGFRFPYQYEPFLVAKGLWILGNQLISFSNPSKNLVF